MLVGKVKGSWARIVRCNAGGVRTVVPADAGALLNCDRVSACGAQFTVGAW